MIAVGEYERRADECRRRAEAMPNLRDRACWLKLAEGWMTASRMQRPVASSVFQQESRGTGLRGETADLRKWTSRAIIAKG
jgi:hypothetical protein